MVRASLCGVSLTHEDSLFDKVLGLGPLLQRRIETILFTCEIKVREVIDQQGPQGAISAAFHE